MNVTFSCILCEKLLYRTLEKSHWLWARDNLDFDRLKFPWLQGVLILQQLKGLLSRGEFFLALTTSPSSNATSSMTLLLLLCNHKINFCCQYVSSRLKLCNFIVWIFFWFLRKSFVEKRMKFQKFTFYYWLVCEDCFVSSSHVPYDPRYVSRLDL